VDAAVGEDDIAAEVDDDPPDHNSHPEALAHHSQREAGFHKSLIRPNHNRTESLLTRALQSPEAVTKPEIHIATGLSRRRSMISNASLASTAELTSDGGLTSPARTNTPSPPIPKSTYTSFAPYSLAPKSPLAPTIPVAKAEPMKPISQEIVANVSVSPTTQPPVVVAPKKRCISFACGGRKDPVAKFVAPPAPEPTAVTAVPATVPTAEEPKRKCTIKFACGNNPKASTEKLSKTEVPNVDTSKIETIPKATETVKRSTARSPSITRKSPRPSMPSRPQRDSSSTIRRASQSPVAIRAKSKYMDLDEKTIQSSEATRFHEFASEQMQEDDWIRKESENPRERLTINDTLKMENAIRRLGNEAEEEALEEDEEEDRDENDSDDGNDLEEDDEDGRDSIDGSDDDASDGNETDNEAGFADSDEETDGEGEFAFWTPGRNFAERETGEAGPYRPSAHRTASASSIDSLSHMSPPQNTSEARRPRRRPIKIRPGTPDLPDSTDFVCGTLDEDRPLEDAYVSCMEARKFAKHKQTPQDIDPSFPTSEPEDEEDEHDILEPANDSEENVWLHGKFEDSDEEPQGRRRSTTNRRKSPAPSPRRLRSPAPHGRRLQSPPPPARRMHSPPPPKTRLRSPPPRKLFGHSPKRFHSPPPARTIRSPPASPTYHATASAIPFAPLGSRPGLTHTKSLPRAPNAFCRQYRASQLAAANGNNTDEGVDDHVRKAIDIVKGLERKRHYRKEKFYKGKGKNQPERRPLPGKGAERMREVGLHMAGKTGTQAPYMLSA
jgi:hypothetical protein